MNINSSLQPISKSEKRALHTIDYGNPPALGLDELLAAYGPGVILVLDEVLQNKTTWYATYQNLWDLMKYGFDVEDIRRRIIHFKIHETDKKVQSLQLNHFISNMILWYAFAATDSCDIMDETFIFNFVEKSIEDVNNFIDTKYVREIQFDADTLSAIIDEMVFHITTVAKYASILAGVGLSVLNIHKTSKKFPEMNEIMYGKPPANMQPHEIEEYFRTRAERLRDIICQSDCDLAPIFKAGKIMSMGQFQEVMVGIGMKPDLNGHTIPYPIYSNIFVDGLVTPSDFLINAQAARKAGIDSKNNIKDPGTHSKRVADSTSHIMLRDDYEMCNTTRFIEYTIHDEDWLFGLNGRYYYDDQDDNKMKCVDAFNDKHLIGRTLQFRSPVTCNSEEGICKYCYGHLFENNQSLASAGAYAGIVESEPLKQNTLKSKHINQTHSEAVEFNEEFNRDFEFITSSIVLKDNAIDTDQAQYLLIEKIYKEEEDDEVLYYCTEYKVVDCKAQVIYNVVPNVETKLYFSKSLLTLMRKSKSNKQLMIAFDDIDESDSLFNVQIATSVITDSTARIKSLINKKGETSTTTLDKLCQDMFEAKLMSNIKIDAVHDEMIIRGLVRRKSDIYKSPDFGPDGDHDDYVIMSVLNSLYNTPSPIESLRRPYLKRQLLSPSFYTKTEPSAMDPLFATALADILPPDHPSLEKTN